MPLSAWRDVLARTWAEATSDTLGIIAAGVAFYAFLALVPLLGATVLVYGLIADPETVARDIAGLFRIMPPDAARLAGQQLAEIAHASTGKQGLGLAVALGLALFGARSAAGAVITALNIAYEETEKRGLIKVNLLALGMTAAGVAITVLGLAAAASLALFARFLPAVAPWLRGLSGAVTHLAMTSVVAAGAATLYRYGPSRERARWQWLTPGSVLFALAWLLLTAGFGLYLADFADYGATYGSLSAVVILLTWMYLSSYALLLGAELNSELELQTLRDSTDGPEEPLGQRGAWVADHVAEAN